MNISTHLKLHVIKIAINAVFQFVLCHGQLIKVQKANLIKNK